MDERRNGKSRDWQRLGRRFGQIQFEKEDGARKPRALRLAALFATQTRAVRGGGDGCQRVRFGGFKLHASRARTLVPASEQI